MYPTQIPLGVRCQSLLGVHVAPALHYTLLCFMACLTTLIRATSTVRLKTNLQALTGRSTLPQVLKHSCWRCRYMPNKSELTLSHTLYSTLEDVRRRTSRAAKPELPTGAGCRSSKHNMSFQLLWANSCVTDSDSTPSVRRYSGVIVRTV